MVSSNQGDGVFEAFRVVSPVSPGELRASLIQVVRAFSLTGMALFLFHAVAITARGDEGATTLASSFDLQVKPFFKQHCERCHNEDKQKSGVRVDHLTPVIEDRRIRLWERIRDQVEIETMPPEKEIQPAAAERQRVVAWITTALDAARSRPAPKNGSARRLTVAQYRNTLRELLLLEDDLTDILPPDSIPRGGFANNQETLAFSPLLLEAYFEIAEEALDRSLVDPSSKPSIQSFRVDLGEGINPDPCPDTLILGANSLLLENDDFIVSQPKLVKPFHFEPFMMRTKYRFIEGYRGNATVRGWRDFESIYHAVFACMRGTPGYPKGFPYNTVPQGLLLRPAITDDETFHDGNTYGPKANFKISLRELPDHGRFRVTVTAAKYEDGLLLDPGSEAQPPNNPGAVVCQGPETSRTATLKKAGVYQIDVYPSVPETKPIEPDASRLDEELIGAWAFDGDSASTPARAALTGRLEGDARFVDSPFGQALALDGDGDSVVVTHDESMEVGNGDFTVSAWISPDQLRQAGIVCLGGYGWTQGWILDMPNDKGVLRIETAGPGKRPNGTVQSPEGTLRADAWQHVTAVVRRGKGETQLFVNGYPVATGTIGPANLDNPNVDLHIGRVQGANQFRGQIDDVRLYRRALGDSEIQALLESGRRFVTAPPQEKPKDVSLALGERRFSAPWRQPAFLVVRLDAGPLTIQAQNSGQVRLGRIVLTLLAEDDALTRRFTTFEQRIPRLGVHVGLRRDCGSTLTQVGGPQNVPNTTLARFEFEGAIRNYPSPDVEKNNVNYLAGIREIGVRSEYTDGRDMPRLLIRSVEFEGPLYDEWPPASHRNIFKNSGRENDPRSHAREVIRDFATRAYRRPITDQETNALMAVFDDSFQAGANFQNSVKDALLVVLTSPQFLFLIENSQTPDPEPLDDYELASKLSYFLWNGPPDRQMLKLAANGSLRDHLDAEITRMIDDPRFSRFVAEFASQWLAIDKFHVLEPDRNRFPKLNRDTRRQLEQEPVQFVQYLIQQNLPARDLIASDFVVANEVVASYYDLGDRTESGFDFVPIPHERRELGGVLSQAAVMAGLSDGRESNPVKRGAWLARRIIAEPPDDPPPNVPALKEETQRLSLRKRLELHRNQHGCVECHSKIDPWGVPFEVFDAGGRRKQEPVDARSTLPDDTDVAGFDELRQYLAEDRLDQVAFSVLKHLATYAIGRDLNQNELETLKRDRARLKPTGYRMQEMIRYVVHSPLFLEK